VTHSTDRLCPITSSDGWLLCMLPAGHEGPHDMRSVHVGDAHLTKIPMTNENLHALPGEDCRESCSTLYESRPGLIDEIAKLRGALAEALDLFDATWCPEHGHAPKPAQHVRVAELRKLVNP